MSDPTVAQRARPPSTPGRHASSSTVADPVLGKPSQAGLGRGFNFVLSATGPREKVSFIHDATHAEGTYTTKTLGSRLDSLY
jgi:hypothetical protein